MRKDKNYKKIFLNIFYFVFVFIFWLLISFNNFNKIEAQPTHGIVLPHHKKKKYLSSVLLNTDLGKLDNIDDKTIIDAIINLNPALKKYNLQITLTRNQEVEVSAPNDFLGIVKASYLIKPPLFPVFTKTELGFLEDEEPRTINEAILRLNPNLKLYNLHMTPPRNKKAEISFPGDFVGSVEVTYQIKLPLNSVLKNKNLGWLDNNEPQTIKNVITGLITVLIPNFDSNDLQITQITPTSAQISSPSYFLGSEQVTFQIKPILSSVLKKNDLGWLDNNEPQTIKDVITQLIPGLNPADLQITQITPTSAQISSPSYFLGSEQVTFQIKPPFSSVLSRKDLGWLDNNEP
ncbi:MAG: hypothetical protein Q8901_01670, partial [Candidatus Phytoplasma stylosanthis]|nr:hypothetical protein [Candidatus Phytoplasma stylosanthis]